MAKTPAWQRAEGKNPNGGLNAKGRASAKAEGHNLKPPQPEGGPRKNSFCARMKGMKAKLTSSETANDPNSRINKSLRAWNCHADGGAVKDGPIYPTADKQDWLISHSYKNRGGEMKMMSPQEFLNRTRPLEIDQRTRDSIDNFKRRIKSGDKMDPLQILANGSEDGRHRAVAAKELGIKQVPVIDFRGDERAFGGAVRSSMDQMMGMYAKGGEVWDKPRPKKLGKSEPLSSKEKKSAKAMAKAAGRPYPNLVDNMRAARAGGGAVEQAMEFVRKHRAEGGDLDGDVQFMDTPKFEDSGSLMARPQEPDRVALPMRPYEQRWNETTHEFNSPERKDIGFYGPVSVGPGDHVASEYSRDSDIGQYPTVAADMPENLKVQALNAARFNAPVPEEADRFAYAKAAERMAQGRSPFYEPGKDPYPKWSPEQYWEKPAIMPELPSKGEELRRLAEQPSYLDYFKAPIQYGVQTMVSPDIAPQRVTKALVEAPETFKQFGQGLAQSAYSGATLPGDVAMGNVDPMSNEGIRRAADLAGLATTGSFGFTRPAGALASGASRPTKEFAAAERALAGMGHNQPPYQRLVNPAGFYSHGHEVAMTQLPEGPRTWQEMQALLQKGNVKKEELRWAGLHPEAYEPSHKITREEIAQQFERNFPQVEPVWKRKQSEMSQDDIARIARYRVNLDNAQRAFSEANTETWRIANPEGTSLSPYYSLVGRDEPIGLLDLRNAIREGNFDFNQIANPEHREAFKNYQDAFQDYQLAEAQMQEAQQPARRQSAGDPKWEQYTYPGGSDYSESILKIPYNRPDNNIAPEVLEKYKPQMDQINSDYNAHSDAAQQVQSEISNINRNYIDANKHKFFEAIKEAAMANGASEEDALQSARDYTSRSHSASNIANYLNDSSYANLIKQSQAKYADIKANIDANRNHYSDVLNKAFAESRNYPEYTTGHYMHSTHLGEIDNPLLHQRWKERIGPEGEKILSNEELQSDWGQTGKEQGFKDPQIEKRMEELQQNLYQLGHQTHNDKARIVKAHNQTDPYMVEYNKLIEPIKNKFYNSKQFKSDVDLYNSELDNADREMQLKGLGSFDEAQKRLSNLLDQYKLETEQKVNDIHNQIKALPKSGDISLAPHIGSNEQWIELGAKHGLAHAIENGHDKIFIMGGQEQARRWQNALRQSVDNIRWEPSKPSEWPELSSIMGHPPITDKSFKTVYARPKGQNIGFGSERMFVVDKEGKVINSDVGEAKGQKLSAIVGSDLAKKIMEGKSGDVPMKNYIMGSEGYMQHYERKVPSIYKDIIKKYLKVLPKVEAGPLLEQGETPKPKGRLVQAVIDQLHEENPPWGRVERQGYDTYRIVRPDGTFSGGFSQESAERALQQAKKEYEENQTKPNGPKTGPHGTYIYITPEMREAYKRIKEQKGAVFPGYKKGGAVESAMDFVRRYREEGGKLEGGVEFMDTPQFEDSGSLMAGRYGEDKPQPTAHEFVQQQLRTGEPQLPQYDPEAGIETAKEAAHLGAYMHPVTRPFAQAYDAYNAAREVMQNPKDPYAWGGLGLSTMFPGSGRATQLAGAAAAGAGVLGPDEAEAGPNTKFLTDLAHFYRSHYDPSARIFGAPTTIKGNRTVAKNWLSDVKLSRPVEEMSVMSRNHRPMVAESFMEPQEMAGKAMITGLGDRTPAGYELTHINEEELANPVNFMGGMGFGRDIASQGKDRSIWGSAKTRAQAISNAAKRAADEGMEPVFTYVAQGPQSSDFSHHMQDIILNQIKQEKMNEKLADFIDRRMRENQTASGSTFAPKPEWVGVRSPEMAERMRQRADERVKLIKLMDAAAFRDAPGFADVGAARLASTDPSLMYDPSFSAGKSFSTINPRGEIVTNPMHPHPSYNTQISAGDNGHGYLGRFEYELPPELHFKHYRENEIADRLRGKPLDKQTMSILKQAPTVVGTPEWVDMASEYQDIMRRMYGRRRP